MVDHDRLFKELLTTFFVEFVDLFLPDLAAGLDRESITFLSQEVFTDVTSGDRHEVDLLARARLLGQNSFFLVHVENQAHAQTQFAKRMFRYFGRLHEKFDLPVYPIAVFSHDSDRPEPDQYEICVSDWAVMRFQFRSIQLKRLDWRQFMRQPNPVAAALMTRMGMAEGERSRVKLECLRLLATLRLDPARQRLISGFVDTYLCLNEAETLQFEAQADTVLGSDEKGRVMELTTSWKEEGRREGLERGRQEGRQEGEATVVIRQLRHRFGELNAELIARLRELPPEKLESLAEALLDFRSLADLEQWFAA